MANNGRRNTVFKPIAVLVTICALTGLALGAVNNLTLPLITANLEARARATYAALVPTATDFVPCAIEAPGVTACMIAEENEGYVIVAQSKGYNGPVPVALAFSPDGVIASIAALPNGETPGLGTKVTNEPFIGQFIGHAAEPIALEDIDAVTGATISSKAALAAINRAIDAFSAVESGSASTPSDGKGVA